MDTKKIMLYSLLIIAVGLGLTLAGCSQFNNSDNNDSNNTGDLNITAPTEAEPPPFNLTRYEYPEQADQAPPGYQLINLSIKADNPNPTTDNGDNDFDVCNPSDSIWAGKYVPYHQSKTIKLEKNELKVKSGCCPENTWITMTKPVANEPWIEFEPHGLVFDLPQTVEVKLYYKDCVLPPGVEPEDLTIWYWHEEIGEYEYIGGDNDVNQERIKFNLDHFSRYVVAAGE